MISAKVGKLPPMQELAAAEPQPFSLPSRAMPGFCLRIWRTDGAKTPVPKHDVTYLINTVWPKHRITNIRNDWNVPATTYEFYVETMPPIPEVPEDVKLAHTQEMV